MRGSRHAVSVPEPEEPVGDASPTGSPPDGVVVASGDGIPALETRTWSLGRNDRTAVSAVVRTTAATTVRW